MCYASPVMLRGRRSCTISERPRPSSFASPSLLRPITPLFPLHPRNSPVTPLFPLHTQKQGGGGSSSKMASPLTLLFSYDIVTKQLSTIVGAPTFPFPHARKDKPRNRSKDRPPANREHRESAGWVPTNVSRRSGVLVGAMSGSQRYRELSYTSLVHLPPGAPSEVKWWHCDHQLCAARARP
jgi:hypothetical protein